MVHRVVWWLTGQVRVAPELDRLPVGFDRRDMEQARTGSTIATKRSFVEFRSPGIITAKIAELAIDAWDIGEALKMSESIKESHGADPFGFMFIERVIAGEIDDGFGGKLKVQPREIRTSGMHYIRGVIRTVEDVRRDALSSERIILSNMECNGWAKIITINNNGLKWSQPFFDGDQVVGF